MTVTVSGRNLQAVNGLNMTSPNLLSGVRGMPYRRHDFKGFGF